MNLPAAPAPARVKICGVTRVEDALAAVAAGADALGFMFYPPSPRFLRLDQAAAIARELPPFVARVGVFVDASPDRVHEAIAAVGLDTLQFHGKESAEYCRGFPGRRLVKAFRMRNPASLAELEDYRGMAWLLDSYVAGAFGGTGQTFNWDLACEAVRRGGTVILAGGLTPDNVGRAVAAVRPFAVDVSSGVESEPGVKDPARMRAFVRAALEG